MSRTGVWKRNIMTETVDQLRKRLREENGRQTSDETTGEQSTGTGNRDSITISSPSTDIERYVPNSIDTPQSDERPLQGLHHGVRSTKRAASDIKRKLDDLTRSSTQINSRERSSPRRYGEDNSQNRGNGEDIRSSTGSSKRRTVGNLETIEPIPPRTFEIDSEREAKVEVGQAEGTTQARKRGRPIKQGDSKPILQIKQIGPIEREPRKFFTGKVLSKTEAEEIKESFIRSLSDELGIVDKALWRIAGDDDLQQPIWSDMTEKELDTIANIVLRLGQKSPVVATMARTSIDADDYITAGLIVGPRFNSTVSLIRETRKKHETVSRRERLRNLR